MKTKIVILGTGGTIAGTASDPGDNVGYRAGQIGVNQLLAALPGVSDQLLHSEQVAQIDSCDMSFQVWQQLVQRCSYWLAQADVTGLVITHGTDTLEETAYFLQSVLAPSKPVVLTCAMRPASALLSDGPQNLRDALVVAACPDARGVLVACAGQVHQAVHVQKVHPYRLDAFSSGEVGPLAFVEEGQLRLNRSWPVVGEPWSASQSTCWSDPNTWPWVEVVFSCAGASAKLVQALVAQGVQGLVVAATGNGTVHHELLTALQQAQTQGVPVRLASRCAQGHLVPHAGAHFPQQQGLPPVKARVALMLELLA